ncbi:DUF1707 domain-containing protein [Kribbella sp.]|uniref:DUF1707 domain-containing protein n=1 Tax=Kribbella sp. TaxID=1871183 RepID=UPI002D70E37D|nr:DUF1707 domain-containing protein [Kribbella sp.]HZX03964.1 DUF1707 domain-containing protein [Kribbella sp.]
MSAADRDRRRRGGPAGRRRRDWQAFGPNWNEGWNGWFDDDGGRGRSRQHNWGGDWHAHGWSGDWRATAWSEPTDNAHPRNEPPTTTPGAGPTSNSAPDSAWEAGSPTRPWEAGPASRPWEAGSADSSRDAGSAGGAWEAGLADSSREAGSGADAPRVNEVPRKRVRIGDVERDQAVAMLSEHFVAGRLTQEEFEERSERATKARYADEFEQLFDELPRSGQLQPVQAVPPTLRRRPTPPPAFLMIAPFLMIGLVIGSVALTAPWLLWGVFWIVMLSGISRRRWQH